MRGNEILIVTGVFILVTVLFFYKFFLFGNIPFPGDLLVSEYNPWKTYSYLGYNPGSYPSKAQYFDVIRQLYPWKTLAIHVFQTGEFPLWNPYNFSGAPLLFNFQSAVFYPLNILYAVFSQIESWTLLIILQSFLSLFFTYLFARKIGISSFGSLFSTISFTFSYFMTVWLEYNTIGHVILWLPLILLSFDHLLEKKNILWSFVFVFSLASSLFAGHLQVFAYLLLFVFAYIVYRLTILHKIRFLFSFVVLLILSVGIGAIQLLPGIELIQHSARSSHSYTFLVNNILIQPWQLIMLVVPDFFGNPATRNYWLLDTYVGKVTSIGLVPLFFILILIFFKKNNERFSKNSIIKFFLAAAGVTLILSTLNPFTMVFYKAGIPFISSSSPTLSLFIFCFCLSLLCGFGIDRWMVENISMRKFVGAVFPLVFVFLSLWIGVLLIPTLFEFSWERNLSISQRNLSYSTGIFGIAIILFFAGILKHKLKYIILIFLLLLHTGDLWRSFEKFNPFSPREFVFPATEVFDLLKKEAGIYRFWGYGFGATEANIATNFSLFSPDGYDPLYPRRYGEFIQSSQNGKIQTEFTTLTRSDARIVPGFGEEDLSSNQYRLKVLDMLGVRYILDRVENKSTEKTFPKERFKLVYEQNGWRILENLHVAPRAFLTSDYKTFRNKEEFENIFFANNFNPSNTILLEKEAQKKSSNKLNDSNHLTNLQMQFYNPNEIIFSVTTKSPHFLFLSDTYYPGWKAYVDGKETKIYRANYAFRSIIVPTGEHKVVFTFESPSFKIGMIISIVSILFTSLFILKTRVYRVHE